MALYVKASEDEVRAYLEECGLDQGRAMVRAGNKFYDRHQDCAERWLWDKDREAP